ncbi:DNA/RNA non-specific endonuclease [Kribbella sp. NPDC050241]|uniref:DNA/RNA non-specific endonuclease n=1 Tax=Kribbella sp. NPDC050241 TaxID=3364115 RepID=UPI00379114B6
MHKSHLIARRFGGSNEAPENMVALYRRANLSGMKIFENQVAAEVNAGASVYYLVRRKYSAYSKDPPVPIGVSMYYWSSSGAHDEDFIPKPTP